MSKDWWRNAAIYQVYPRSFADSNGDGEGDLKGIIEKIDYIRKLGVDAIWLSPFYKSPNKDGGYDVSDPRDVDSRFGTLKDAELLIKTAHDQGVRVIVDIVPNHFSTEHHWFQAALHSAPGSPERSRFHFYDGRGSKGEIPPNNWNSIFGGPAWTRIREQNGEPGQWYLHLFDSSQADLNWNNQEVHQDFETTLRFWLERGVDGFRIDVAHGLAKDEILRDHRDPEGLTRALRLDISDMKREVREALLTDVPFFDRDGVHDIYRNWRNVLEEFGSDRMSVAEAWVHPSSRAARYVRRDELHQIFNFDFLIAPWESEFLIAAIKKTLDEVSSVGAPPTWVLCNHDSPRLVSRLGGGEIGREKARAFALLTQALPGGVYIYQGEELGLPDGELPDDSRQDPVFFRTEGRDKGRDGARVPLPWNSQPPFFGFSQRASWLPMSEEWGRESVANQNASSSSFLSLYRRGLEIRKKNPALQPTISEDVRTSLRWLQSPSGVIGFERDPNFLLFANTNEDGCQIELDGVNFEVLLASTSRSSVQISIQNRPLLHLPAHATVWLQRIS